MTLWLFILAALVAVSATIAVFVVAVALLIDMVNRPLDGGDEK